MPRPPAKGAHADAATAGDPAGAGGGGENSICRQALAESSRQAGSSQCPRQQTSGGVCDRAVVGASATYGAGPSRQFLDTGRSCRVKPRAQRRPAAAQAAHLNSADPRLKQEALLKHLSAQHERSLAAARAELEAARQAEQQLLQLTAAGAAGAAGRADCAATAPAGVGVPARGDELLRQPGVTAAPSEAEAAGGRSGDAELRLHYQQKNIGTRSCATS